MFKIRHFNEDYFESSVPEQGGDPMLLCMAAEGELDDSDVAVEQDNSVSIDALWRAAEQSNENGEW